MMQYAEGEDTQLKKPNNQLLNNIVHVHLSCFPDVGLTRSFASLDVFCRYVVENKVLLAALLSHLQVSSRI